MVDWCRRHLFIVTMTLIGCAATIAAPFLFHFWSQEIKTQTVASSGSSETQTVRASDEAVSPRVEISSLHVSEVAMDIPAVFELEVQVTGSSDAVVRGAKVILDFGRAEVDVCGYMPKSAVTTVIADDKNYRHFELAELRKSDKLYIRCLTSAPVFNRIIIEGDNIHRGESMDFREYRESLSKPRGFWIRSWEDYFSGVVVMFLVGVSLLFLLWLLLKIV